MARNLRSTYIKMDKLAAIVIFLAGAAGVTAWFYGSIESGWFGIISGMVMAIGLAESVD